MKTERKFKTPYVNAKYIIPALALVTLAAVALFNAGGASDFLHARKLKSPDALAAGLTPGEKFSVVTALAMRTHTAVSDTSVARMLGEMDEAGLRSVVRAAQLPEDRSYDTGWDVFKHQIPLWLFFVVTGVITVLCWRHNLSLIPVLGLISCFYLMSELGFTNWMRFLIWLTVGLVIYFTYSRTHSHLASRRA